MNQLALFGIATSLIIGLTIGFQSIFAARVSLADNAVSTGLMMLILGGIIAAAILAALYPTGIQIAHLDGARVAQMAIGGVCGVIIVVGSAFAFTKVSPAAAVAIIIFGQMSLAIVADMFGLTGQAPQSLDMRRIGGLLLLAGAIWLLIPRNDG